MVVAVSAAVVVVGIFCCKAVSEAEGLLSRGVAYLIFSSDLAAKCVLYCQTLKLSTDDCQKVWR